MQIHSSSFKGVSTEEYNFTEVSTGLIQVICERVVVLVV